MPKDQSAQFDVNSSELVFRGRVWDVVSETFDYHGESLTRDFVRHPGAVAVLALNEANQVLMIRQYRHPVRKYLWELPAGLLDVPGESLVDAAKRELAEEAGYAAQHWEELTTFHPSPGGNSESITIFLSKGCAPITTDFVAEGAARDLLVEWVDFDVALAAVLASEIQNPSACLGILHLSLRIG
ncbi:MAG: NUDIX domain-containing protein [Microbacteriaceae bacterium]